MRYEAVSAELIRAVRGKRSQLAFSRHLGYRCNVLYTWESGRRWPTIATFVRAALRTRIDVFSGLRSFVGADADWLTADVADPKQLALLLDKLRGTTPVAELARRVGVNRVSVSRWLHGQAEPRLPDFLQLVEAACGRALDFIALFVEPRQLPECASAWRELEAQRQVAYGLPWSHAVLRVLELVEYQALPEHEDAWIAARLGISNSEVSTCMRALAASKLIVRRRKRWVVSRVLTVDTRLNPGAGTQLKRHWAEVGLERLVHLEPRKNDMFSYNLFTVSEQDWQRIRERHIAYYQELRGIVAESQPAERVVLLNLQLMRLDEPLSG
jgi:transcriptional regulator with XRE-family HTH domain